MAIIDFYPKMLRGRLTILVGPCGVGDTYELKDPRPVTIGRHVSSQITLEDHDVSRLHARLVPLTTGWRIQDRGSSNGVWVNGHQVQSHNLRHGDHIRLGPFVLCYQRLSAPPPAPLSPDQAAATALRSSPAEFDFEFDVDALIDDPDDHSYELNPTDSPASPESPTYACQPHRGQKNPPGHASPPSHTRRFLLPGMLDHPVRIQVRRPKTASTCPSCKKSLGRSARVCVDCGIYTTTGRPLRTTRMIDPEKLYNNTHRILGGFSLLAEIPRTILVLALIALPLVYRDMSMLGMWFIALLLSLMPSFGVYPVASEAYGAKRPWAVWLIAAATVALSVAGWYTTAVESVPQTESWVQDLMLWPMAHHRFHGWQLVTHTFLHGNLGHLASNFLFLFLIGSRVNALIGNVATLILYPILGALAGWSHLTLAPAFLTQATLPGAGAGAMIGASGAIMGLAGIYFLLFFVQKIHMAGFVRWSWLFLFHFRIFLWEMRGFWVLLAYIGLDVFMLATGSDASVARWAHVGGFAFGTAIGLLLLMTRAVNPRGSDILTTLFGKASWWLLGPPAQWTGPHQHGWLEQLDGWTWNWLAHDLPAAFSSSDDQDDFDPIPSPDANQAPQPMTFFPPSATPAKKNPRLSSLRHNIL